MTLIVQNIVDGIATGSIYALLALAIIIIHRSTGVANFAQGEMAMFSTYIAWQLTQFGLPLLVAIAATLVFAFGLGWGVERSVIRPVAGQPLLNVVVITIGLFLIFNQGATMIWSGQVRKVESFVPAGVLDVGGVRVSYQVIAMVLVLLVCSGLLYLLFQRTTLGLAMRAAAVSRESSSLVGIPVERMLMLGWGLAGVIGAVAGIMIAPRLFLEPNMMFGPLIFAFAAAVLGGIDSAPGAILGGLIVGISETFTGSYVDFLGPGLKIVVPFLIIVAVLLVRPQGLLGHREVVRV